MKAYDEIPEWREISFSWVTRTFNNLPEYNKEVIVTDGNNVWIDAFAEYMEDKVCIVGACCDANEATAWMPLPTPYRGE